MIIGAGGSLGRHICNLLYKNNYMIVAIDINENSVSYLNRVYDIPENNIFIEDIRNFSRICNIIDYFKIDVIVNCAALKHVMWCEFNIKQAIETNVIANLELANYMYKNKKEFLYISSDKAFNPKNIYALTKQFTDYIVNFYNFKIIRGVNFLNSKGSVLDIWEEQRRHNKPFTVIDDKKCNRYFITLDKMSELVKIAIEDKNKKNEYVPESVYKIYIRDLFEAYLELHNISRYKIKEIFLSETEKITEDLNFTSEIKEIKDVNIIINLLKENGAI